MAFIPLRKSRFSATGLQILTMRTLLLCTMLLASSGNIFAQHLNDSPKRALANVFEKGNLMVALSDQQWRPGLALAAAHLSVGKTVSLNVSLEKGINYVFLASGNDVQTDVDLYLRDSSGVVMAQDQQDDGTPVVEFSPSSDGMYQLQLHLVAANEASTYVALSLLRQGGLQISDQGYHSVATGFFAATQTIRKSTPEVAWQKQVGTWCLFGYSLREEEGATLRGLQSAEGQKVVAAAAGPEPVEISLYLGTDDGQIIAGTQQPTAYPLLSYFSPGPSTLDLRIDAERARAHILVLVGVFHQ